MACLTPLQLDNVDDMVLVVDSSGDEGGAQPLAGDDGVVLRRLHELGRARQAPEPVRWQRQSPQLMEFARRCLAEKVAQRKAEEEARKRSSAEALNLEVCTYFPSVATSVGVSTKGKVKDKTPELTEERAAHLLRLAFMPSPRDIKFGIKPVRLHAFAAALVLDCQQDGLRHLLWQCAQFKAQSSKNRVVAYVLQDIDGTKQDLAILRLQRLGRPSARRVGVEVLYQSCKLHLMLCSGDETAILEESFICRPLASSGKTAPFVVKAIEMCKPFDLEDEQTLQALACATDVVIEDLRCDKGSNNIPALRHFAATLESNLSTGISDNTCCEVHVLHKVKTSSPDTVAIVGKLFSLGDLLKLGSVTNGLVDNIERLVDQSLERLEMEAPRANVSRWRQIFDELFDLDASHHKRRSSRTAAGHSQLISDLHELMGMLNDEINSDRWVHYCFDRTTRAPCCASLSEAKEKTTVCLINLFATPAFPIVTTSRFTYVLKGLSKVICGRACKDILSRCIRMTPHNFNRDRS